MLNNVLVLTRCRTQAIATITPVGAWCATRYLTTAFSNPPSNNDSLNGSNGGDDDGNNSNWNTKFEAYKSFIAQHGIRSKVSDKALHQWVSRQKFLLKSGELQDNRKTLFETLDLPHDIFESKWSDKYSLLKDDYQKNGTARLSEHDGDVLFHFVQRQRKLYGMGQLSPERIQLLEAINFDFSVYEGRWHTQYEALKAFHRQYGHTCVPQDKESRDSLARWVDLQRQQYRKRELRKERSDHGNNEHFMTDERLDLLNQIDFCWNVFDEKWNLKYLELKEYVQIHGPGKSPSSLKRWLRNQRTACKDLLLGEKSSTSSPKTAERLKKLQLLGFLLSPST